LVDKPAGPTSHDVVSRVRRTLGIRAAGHTGTLDPFATGLLVVLVGRATRLARFLEGEPKRYLATARLGVRTDTDDPTGAVLGERVPVDAVKDAGIRAALAEFLGRRGQRPPAYSAKHVGGERSYRRARRGEAVALAEVEVRVHRIELVSYRPPEVTFRATVSAGTYLRAIARDLGDRLGVGAHLVALRREAISSLRVEEAVPLERIDVAALRPPCEVLTHLPAVSVDADARAALLHGRSVEDPEIRAEGKREGGVVAVLAERELIAVANRADGWLKPVVVLGVP
jgi:tRNA pseudouridine55 synthase